MCSTCPSPIPLCPAPPPTSDLAPRRLLLQPLSRPSQTILDHSQKTLLIAEAPLPCRHRTSRFGPPSPAPSSRFHVPCWCGSQGSTLRDSFPLRSRGWRPKRSCNANSSAGQVPKSGKAPAPETHHVDDHARPGALLIPSHTSLACAVRRLLRPLNFRNPPVPSFVPAAPERLSSVCQQSSPPTITMNMEKDPDFHVQSGSESPDQVPIDHHDVTKIEVSCALSPQTMRVVSS